ncbi:MAG: hypothetical protein K6C34_00840 [Alphaproteobacteria bacterium]|nr:hypothetical protein [Alphaproteobacteria bacterium]
MLFNTKEGAKAFFTGIIVFVIVMFAISACACGITVQHILFGEYSIIQKIITSVIFGTGGVISLSLSVAYIFAYDFCMEFVMDNLAYTYDRFEEEEAES